MHMGQTWSKMEPVTGDGSAGVTATMWWTRHCASAVCVLRELDGNTAVHKRPSAWNHSDAGSTAIQALVSNRRCVHALALWLRAPVPYTPAGCNSDSGQAKGQGWCSGPCARVVTPVLAHTPRRHARFGLRAAEQWRRRSGQRRTGRRRHSAAVCMPPAETARPRRVRQRPWPLLLEIGAADRVGNWSRRRAARAAPLPRWGRAARVGGRAGPYQATGPGLSGLEPAW